MSIVYAYFFDQFFFHQTLDGLALAAALVILVSAFSIAVYKLKLKRDKKLALEKE